MKDCISIVLIVIGVSLMIFGVFESMKANKESYKAAQELNCYPVKQVYQCEQGGEE